MSAVATAAAVDPRTRVRCFCERYGFGPGDLERLSGGDRPNIHRWLGGHCTLGPGAVDHLLEAVAEYEYANPRAELIERRGNTIDNPTPVTSRFEQVAVFQRTTAARAVLGALDYCASQRLSGGIFADPGVGKTVAARQWSATTRHRHLFVTARPFTTYTRLLHALGAELFGTMPHVIGGLAAAALDDRLHEELASKPRLLVIDEADMLGPRTLDWLRTIQDASDGRSTFVLIAKPAFYLKLSTYHARSNHDLRQLWSRIAFRRFLSGITREEMMCELDARGVSQSFDAEALEALYATTAGSYRDLTMVLALINQILKENPRLQGRATAVVVAKAEEMRFGAGIGRHCKQRQLQEDDASPSLS